MEINETKEYMKQYYIKNKEEIDKYQEKYRNTHKVKTKIYDKQYREDNKEKIKRYQKKYYRTNHDKLLKKAKEWHKNNYEKRREYNKNWCLNNKIKWGEYYKEYVKKRRKIDLKFNLDGKIKCAINRSLKSNKNGRHWEDLVGYTLDDLIKHLKKTMPKGYNWNDYMESRLHIDHKIPIKVFNYIESEHIDFKRCWALSNLQLLPAKENLKKNDKLHKPFQPALRIMGG